jgi:hypothetical protein
MNFVLSLPRYAQTAHRFVTNSWRRAVHQERILATTTFALIFATTLTCVDFLITGAPDWNPGGEAYAMEPVRRVAAAPVVEEVKTPEVVMLTAALVERRIDYSYTSEVLLGGPDMDFMSTAKFELDADLVPAQAIKEI